MIKDSRNPIAPVFGRTDAAVCIVSSEAYAPFAGVVVASVMANAGSGRNYDIVILSSDMTEATEKRICAQTRENVSIRVVDVTPFIQGLEFYTVCGISANTYYRLLAPDIFQDYEKIVYLDSDIVVNRDIADLYALDVAECYMAAALDTRAVSFCTRAEPLQEEIEHLQGQLGLKDVSKYYQGGVALYNLKRIRKDFPNGRLIREALGRQYRYMDQDLTNVLFEGRVLELPSNWNVMVADHDGRCFEAELPESGARAYYEARQDPWIIHYLTRMMPCCVTKPDMEEYFWKYARISPFYSEILAKMIRTEAGANIMASRARTIGNLTIE